MPIKHPTVEKISKLLDADSLPLPTIPLDLLEVAGCTCLRLRKTARRLTQIYDEALAPASLTVTQFGLLAYLSGFGDLSIGELAERTGMDPTSLNRTIKPLQRKGLLSEKPHKGDKRFRIISLSKRGQSITVEAIKLWKTAQDRVTAKLGIKAVESLNHHLDLAFNEVV